MEKDEFQSKDEEEAPYRASRSQKEKPGWSDGSKIHRQGSPARETKFAAEATVGAG